MKKQFYTFPLILLLSLNWSCVKKDLELDIQQSVCKKFKIKQPSYRIIEDACVDGTSVSFEIKFTFDGSEECLHTIENSPVFYSETNQVFNPLSFSSTSITKENFTISGQEITYLISIEFSDAASAKVLNHIVLDFFTKNELDDESNTIQIRLNTSCSKVSTGSYEMNPDTVNIPISAQTFTITLWDNASEDGDIVSVFLNGNWIIENFSLLNNKTDFVFSTTALNFGRNDLVIFALNEGSSGPNTVSVAINGKEIQNFKPGLLTGEGIEINF